MMPGLLAVLIGLAAGLGVLALLLAVYPAHWLRATPRGSLTEADHLVVLSMGLTRDAQGCDAAGDSNVALATWLLANNSQRLPTIVQYGVYLALVAQERAHPKLNLAAWVVCLPHNPAIHVDTIGAVWQCGVLAAARGWSRPAVIAHDLQQQRAAWLFERVYGAERVVVPDLPEIPFDAGSHQHGGTRSRRTWVLWELLLARPAQGRYREVLALVAAAGTVTLTVAWGVAHLVGSWPF